MAFTKNKTFFTKIVFALLRSTLMVGLASSAGSFGMVQWNQGESSSSAGSLPQQLAVHDEHNQLVPARPLDLDLERFGIKFRNPDPEERSVPTEVEHIIQDFAVDNLQELLINSPGVSPDSLIIMRHIAQRVAVTPELKRNTKEFAELNKLYWLCVTKVARFLCKPRDNKEILMGLFNEHRKLPFPRSFVRDVAHFAYPYVYGPDRVRPLATISNQRDQGQGPLCAVVDPADGALKIVSARDNTIRILRETGQCLATSQGQGGHTAKISCLQVVKDPANNQLKIISGSWDSTIKIWDMAGGLLATCQGQGGHTASISCLQVVKDPADNNQLKIISGSLGGTIKIWNMAGQWLATCYGHTLFIECLQVVKDPVENQLKIISGSWDNTIKIWNMAGGRPLATCHHEHGFSLSSLQVVKDPADTKLKIISGSWGGTIKIWDMTTLCCLATCQGGYTKHVCVIKDPVDSQLKIITGSTGNTIKIWDTTGRCLENHDLPNRPVYLRAIDVCINPTTNQLFIVVAQENVINILDNSGICIAELQSNCASKIDTISVVPIDDGQTKIIARHEDGNISVFINIHGAHLHHDADLGTMIAPGKVRRFGRILDQKFLRPLIRANNPVNRKIVAKIVLGTAAFTGFCALIGACVGTVGSRGSYKDRCQLLKTGMKFGLKCCAASGVLCGLMASVYLYKEEQNRQI